MPQPAKGNGTGTKPRTAPIAKPPIERHPTKFTYALKQWTVERRESGWHVSQTAPSLIGSKPEWHGPFETIESACLAIARRHATELADRHTRSIEHHKIARSSPLFGLKPTTKL